MLLSSLTTTVKRCLLGMEHVILNVCGHHFRFGTWWIKEVASYKYLGVELDKCLSFKDFKARMLGKARWNMLRVWYMMGKNGISLNQSRPELVGYLGADAFGIWLRGLGK